MLVCAWDTLTLENITLGNHEKTVTECLEELITELIDIQGSLSKEYRNSTIQRNKLINMVCNISPCRLAYYKTADTVPGAISGLHSSVALTPERLSSVAGKCTQVFTPNVHKVYQSFVCSKESRPNHYRSNFLHKTKVYCLQKRNFLVRKSCKTRATESIPQRLPSRLVSHDFI